MTIDLKTAKKGDRVTHRNGGVSSIRKIGGFGGTFFIILDGYSTFEIAFSKDGGFAGQEHPFDIVKIESVFDWKDVKPGMAFWTSKSNAKLGQFVGLAKNGLVVLDCTPTHGIFWVGGFDRQDLTRAPEHDAVPEWVK